MVRADDDVMQDRGHLRERESGVRGCKSCDHTETKNEI